MGKHLDGIFFWLKRVTLIKCRSEKAVIYFMLRAARDRYRKLEKLFMAKEVTSAYKFDTLRSSPNVNKFLMLS